MRIDIDLFASQSEILGHESRILRGFAGLGEERLMEAIHEVESQAPFRHMATPNGFVMSVATTNCGSLGWTSDRHGYQYVACDPTTGRRWPIMPQVFVDLAESAAAAAGFAGFSPDACLINRYAAGARLSLHQDKNERDFSAPIVSVSLGVAATFLFGGDARGDKTIRTILCHGDVAVWGGRDRMRFHGVAPLRNDAHPLTGSSRLNLTFRRAG